MAADNIPFSEIIRELTGGMEPMFTIKEIATIMQVSEKTIYSYKYDESEPSYSRIRALSRAAANKGYMRIAAQMFPDEPGDQANGRIDDEYMRIVNYMGHAIDEYRPNSKAQFLNRLEQIKQQVRILEAEADKL